MKKFLSPYLTKQTILAGLIGLSTALALGYNFGMYTLSGALGYALPNQTVTYSGEVHVHADFSLYIANEQIHFTDKKYQSEEKHILDAAQHFHDGNDEVVHRHANNATLVNFLHSIGVTLTDTCLTLDTGLSHCNNDTEKLILFVNGIPVPDITHYQTVEKDRILLYYGDPKNPHLGEYITGVTDESCLYSRTCPERGDPPTESCGLTCDVANIIEKQH